MAIPQEILQLVARFKQDSAGYREGTYNETQLRIEFLNPFFKALGWDMDNSAKHSLAAREVLHEYSLKIEGRSKAPDYCFRAGGNDKFFVEAKKPAVNLESDPRPAFQTRVYGWNRGLSFCILTDFEEFAVYDCRFKPALTESAQTARVFYCRYDEYDKNWEKIAEWFGRDAVHKGAIEAAAALSAKKGSVTFDADFLKLIEGWRKALAENIVARNKALSLSSGDLNFAVQMTIDRILFLRMCEDRDIEPFEQLQKISQKKGVYSELLDLFFQADNIYNSGLFRFPLKGKTAKSIQIGDPLTPQLKIDDGVLESIIYGLYSPNPYNFRVMPVEILGQVYEQFLGKVIGLDKNKVCIEEKPEVRKAGGVYYTPSYIVEYIVRQTVGKLCDGKTPKDVEKIKVLDPACGSGSFLIGAYNFLLAWHLEFYTQHDPEKSAARREPVIFRKADTDEGSTPSANTAWRLTTREKKRILLANVFGVDIDRQAVEVTKLSLLLKMLEDESRETLPTQQSRLLPSQERLLPDLDANIKCGNSLIAQDFYDSDAEYSQAERERINAFDWDVEFSEIMNGGGFDAVIGNPPYIFTREQLSINERNYFSINYKASWEKQNTFMLFMELMLRLINQDGEGGFIVPNSWLTMESAQLLRQVYIPRLQVVTDLNYPVFHRVSMEPCIFVASGQNRHNPVLTARAHSQDEFIEPNFLQIDRFKWGEPNYRIVFSDSEGATAVADRMASTCGNIGDVFEVRTGLQAYEQGKGNPSQTAEDVKNHIFDRTKWENADSFRYLQGGDVSRYGLEWSCNWMQYGSWLSQPREIGMFRRPRLLLREITSAIPYCLHATYEADTYLNNKSILNILHPDDNSEELKCLLGILNSSVISMFYKQKAVKSARKIFPKVVIKNLREFPYPKTINKVKRSQMVKQVERMLEWNQQLAKARTQRDAEVIERQIASADKQIDRLVYELYDLTDEEIALVESAAK